VAFSISEASMKTRELTLAASTARTPTAGTNGTSYPCEGWQRAICTVIFTAKATDSGDLCDVYVDISPDSGTTWINAIHFTQALGNGTDAATEFGVLFANTPGTATIAATADATSGVVRPTVFGNLIRARWIIVNSGTADASFTFAVKALLEF
jgi:hypothetical protein